MAFIRKINQNSVDSHQTSPAYQLTFLRWANRDTKNFQDKDYLDLREPFIVINDCISITTNSSKASHVHQASMILMGGDINYSTAVAPGDFVLINLVNSDEALFGRDGTPENPADSSLYARARNKKAINKKDDGFKGLFKIQSVRRILQIDPNGVKTFHYQVNAAAFTEFNQVVYFNPYLFDSTEEQGAGDVINSAASKEWAQQVSKSKSNLRSIFKSFVGFLIGQGFPANYIPQKQDVVRNHNQSFQIPTDVAKLMGINISSKNVRAADLFKYYVGIEQYGSPKDNKNHDNDSVGLNPKDMTDNTDGNFYNTGPELSGVSLIQPEPWAQVTAWSILNQYSNSLINEMYTTYKLTPDNIVMPCVVYRQKPFSSALFKRNNSQIDQTGFLDLPRWKIAPELIKSLSLGRDEAARINFVHIVGKTRFINQQDEAAQQAAARLHKQDADDIKRNGLRPFISACDFDFPSDQSKNSKAPIWNALMFDWLTNGHLKENGTLVCAGLPDNIAVGDNCQINDTVLHIESINHVMQLTADGKKKFETTLTLSYGVDTRSDSDKNPIYPEMTNPDGFAYRKDDFDNHDQMLPGFSDTQDIAGRTKGEEVKESINAPFSTIPKNNLTDATKKTGK